VPPAEHGSLGEGPARTTIVVNRHTSDLRIEIRAVGYKPRRG
jgi:hypothetical protein